MATISEHLANPETVRKTADVAIYGGGSLGVLGSAISKLTLSDWGVIIGILVAVLGGIFGALLKLREHRLAVRNIKAELSEREERKRYWQRLNDARPPYFHPSPELRALEVQDVEEA
ncbi:hypothetical protein IHQ56_02795 [Methylobacillus flagellatus]|uniref:hypothetical protein n=1 Tax=Methylobacillus flagellatus TaxID=405 RepID=UPI0028538BDE|nr:hypothetical protein [Methylobacillus flagellatus]MDR5170738.1 hypothetical protein [Methylobacillus flagellatus]